MTDVLIFFFLSTGFSCFLCESGVDACAGECEGRYTAFVIGVWEAVERGFIEERMGAVCRLREASASGNFDLEYM